MKVVTILLLICSSAICFGDDFATGNTIFTAKILQELASKNTNKNVLVSPLSAEIILALLQAGGKDDTSKEIRRALTLPNTSEKTQNSIKAILPALKGGDDFTLNTANKIFVQDKFPIRENFQKLATEVYDAGIENLDFSQTSQAAKTINDWVEEKTQNKIHNLIDPNDLDPGTALLLVNALHFKGQWITAFSNRSTQKKDFYKTDGNAVQVDTMHLRQKRFNYFEDQALGAKFLELPFKGNKVFLVIVLPDEKNGVGLLENNLEEVFKDHTFSKELINLALPKFKIEDKIDFTEILKNLGMRKAFDPLEADFSEIAGKKRELAVGKVLQKTLMEVDENGAEAAAATSVGLVFFSAPSFQSVPIDFTVDHPFLFYLKVDNLILFAGKIVEPTY